MSIACCSAKRHGKDFLVWRWVGTSYYSQKRSCRRGCDVHGAVAAEKLCFTKRYLKLGENISEIACDLCLSWQRGCGTGNEQGGNGVGVNSKLLGLVESRCLGISV